MKHCIYIFVILVFGILNAQTWVQDDSVFNPSGIPSLSFAQPRFCDFDADGIWDFWLGNSSRSPVYIKNTGTSTAPVFRRGADYAYMISDLDAEVAVSVDMDDDGLWDLVTGGHTGLHLFQNQGSSEQPIWVEVAGYFADITAGLYPVMDFADLDGDGDLDMVLGFSEDGSVKVYYNTGSTAQGIFSSDNMSVIGNVGLYAYPTFVDYDGDGLMDILCGRDGQGFVFYENTGTSSNPVWQENNVYFSGLGMGSYWNAPTMADINADGRLDLLYGTSDGFLKLYYNQGTVQEPNWQENTSIFGGMIDVGGASNPIFYDWDGDGDYDMICGQNMGYIKFYRNVGTPYAPAWEEEDIFGDLRHTLYSAVTIGDLDGDGLPDVVMGVFTGALYFHRNTGEGFEELTGYLPVSSIGGWAAPRLIDMDNDGLWDLVIGLEDGTLRFYKNIGSSNMPAWEESPNFFGNIDVGSMCVPTFGDWDSSDNYNLMIAGNLSGNLKAYRRGFSWNEDTSLVAGISTSQNATPALVDLDHDGDLDLVVGNYDGTFSYYRNTTYSADNLAPPSELSYLDDGTLLWGAPIDPSSPLQYYLVFLDDELLGQTTLNIWELTELAPGIHTASVKAQYIAGLSIAATVQIAVVANDDLVQKPYNLRAYPNPFGAQNINFELSLSKRSQLRIDIYNLRGQKVKSLFEGKANAGNIQLNWDGCDGQGRQMPKGVYLCKVVVDSKLQIRKILKN